MAIIKRIECDNGVDAEYIRIDSISLIQNCLTNSKEYIVRYSLYKDKLSRESRKRPISENLKIVLNNRTSLDTSNDLRVSVYGELKNTEKFFGAVDDI